MSGFKIPNFNDRLDSAQKAKQAALEKFKAKPGPNDPEFQARQAELAAKKAAEQEAYEAELRAQEELETKQKAIRDARYAARKAAKKG
jgi:DNA-binding helix-hairpin-helix protein with protein kinase domain